jgi:hypothetical protein
MVNKEWKEFMVSKHRDPKPASADSWWLNKGRFTFVPDPDNPGLEMAVTFSQFAAGLFAKQHDAMAGIGPGQPWIKPEQP